jgi:YspA, cpYpsA-related SLOG family
MSDRPLRILITGSRTWTDRTAIAQAISDYLHPVGTSVGGVWPCPIIVHGGARGTDQLAGQVARGWGWSP